MLLHLSAQDEATIHCSACRAEEARTRTRMHARTREYPGSTPRVPREYPMMQWYLRRRSAHRRADWAHGGDPSGARVSVDRGGGG